VVSIGLFTRIQFELLPETDGGKIQAFIELPQGSDLGETAAVLNEIEQRIAGYDEVETLLTTLGSMGSMDVDVSVAQMNIFLTPKKDRARSHNELAADMTRLLSDIPGVKIRITGISELSLGSQNDMDLFLKGPDSAVLRDLSTQIIDVMNAVPGITNTASSSKAVKQELVFRPDRKQVSDDGITVQALALTLRAAVEGFVATTYKEDGEEYDVRVSIMGSSLKDIEDIRNIALKEQDGVPVKVGQVAEVRIGPAFRRGSASMDGKGEAVTGMVLTRKGVNTKAVVERVKERIEEIRRELPEGVTLKPYYDQTELVEKTIETVKEILFFSGGLVIVVLFA
ncbi:MAG TPA: efflux RND transporter permease subunit, partial [Synergistaceae bacterium]|nr:efflux RND transporter permease subunit [Synergistaceae bacterium]